MGEFTGPGFELPPSPFAEEHRMLDQMIRSRVVVDIFTERAAMRRMGKRRKFLTPRQRHDIGSSEKRHNELSAEYGVSYDHVVRLKQQYKRGEL